MKENFQNGEPYTTIARVYDIFNGDIDYKLWADFIEKCFDKYLLSRPELVLDLACGTGRMTRELAQKGYDMIGVDASCDMLAEAMNKTSADLHVLYLLQDMREFELYGTVGAVISCLDSVNYLTDDDGLAECFACVHNYLDPNGLFIFDINSPYKFENVYSDNCYIFEDEMPIEGEDSAEIYCGWQNCYDPNTRLCDFYLTVFTDNGDGGFTREDETQCERCYTVDEITRTLEKCGFEVCAVSGSFELAPPSETDERIYFVARCKK